MRNIKFILITSLLCITAMASAQSIREEILADTKKSVGVYYLYEAPAKVLTKAPKGYKPFYISHYGRHGSRYMLTNEMYDGLKIMFDEAAKAGALSAFGKDVHERVKAVCEEARDRGGELSPKGFEQHRGIAERMYRNYPALFKGDAKIYAQSTHVLRCIHSMYSFNGRLKELNPKLDITFEGGKRPTRHLNFLSGLPDLDIDPEYNKFIKKGPWVKELEAFEEEHLPTGRLMNSLFSDKEYAASIDDRKLMRELLDFARSVRNMEVEFNFDDVFTAEEFYWESVVDNYEFYIKRGPSELNAGYGRYYADDILVEILEKADAAVAGNGPAADLRFGHDGNILCFLDLMEIGNCSVHVDDPVAASEAWPVFRITPMAANLQMIFLRNKAGDVIVKFLLNEQETSLPIESIDGVHYRWSDVRRFYQDILDNLVKPSFK